MLALSGCAVAQRTRTARCPSTAAYVVDFAIGTAAAAYAIHAYNQESAGGTMAGVGIAEVFWWGAALAGDGCGR